MPPSAADGAVTDEPAEQDPEAGDDALRQTVDKALRTLAESSAQPSREQVRDSLVSQGIPGDLLEISASTTPTGLAADAIQVGVRGDDTCVVAYIRDGAVSSAVLPLLSNGLCFLGSDRG
ncbi:DUF6993 domain-containing protein [Arthrobacter sp. TMT4-20]